MSNFIYCEECVYHDDNCEILRENHYLIQGCEYGKFVDDGPLCEGWTSPADCDDCTMIECNNCNRKINKEN